MFGDIMLALLVIAIAYLLGSIPSAYIVGRLLKGLDMKEVGDGRMGAAATFRRVGLRGAIIVGIVDIGKGVAAVLLAQNLVDQDLGFPFLIVFLAGLAVVVGHNWSIFLRFKGGKGALTTYGVLVSLLFWQFFIALALGGISYFITHKSGLSTGIVLGFLSLISWLTGSLMHSNIAQYLLLSILPILISLPMVLKHIFMPKISGAAGAIIENSGNKEG
jgi:glycerol-3-phosphate acyltransferase PlsY